MKRKWAPPPLLCKYTILEEIVSPPAAKMSLIQDAKIRRRKLCVLLFYLVPVSCLDSSLQNAPFSTPSLFAACASSEMEKALSGKKKKKNRSKSNSHSPCFPFHLFCFFSFSAVRFFGVRACVVKIPKLSKLSPLPDPPKHENCTFFDLSLSRLVYKWFLLLYRASYFSGIAGYVIMMATFMGLYLFFGVKPHVWMDVGILLMFYALYYGVMARDFAEICAEKMASR